MPADAVAIALLACAAFGYGFFLGHWAGRREGRRDRKLATWIVRTSRIAAFRQTDGATFEVRCERNR